MDIFRLIIAGGSDFDDYDLLRKKADVMLSAKRYSYHVEIVSGRNKGADTLGEQYAKANGFAFKGFPAEWKLSSAEGHEPSMKMADHADACICFWNGKSKGAKRIIDLARAEGIYLRVIRY